MSQPLSTILITRPTGQHQALANSWSGPVETARLEVGVVMRCEQLLPDCLVCTQGGDTPIEMHCDYQYRLWH